MRPGTSFLKSLDGRLKSALHELHLRECEAGGKRLKLLTDKCAVRFGREKLKVVRVGVLDLFAEGGRGSAPFIRALALKEILPTSWKRRWEHMRAGR